MNPMNMNGGNMPNGVPGGMAAMNNAANAGTPRTQQDSDTSEYKAKLNTYIYDYLLKNEQYECARLLLNSSLNVITKPPGAKKRNEDSMDTDSKDDLDLKKPADLPLPDRILDANTENSFLLDWFTLFWEIFLAPRAGSRPKNINPSAVQYANHIRDQSRARQEAQNNFLRQPGMGNVQQYNMMRMQQGMAPQNMNDLRNRLNAAQNPRLTQQQQQQIMHSRMLQQQQMERAGSEAEMNGQRPRTPSSAMMQGMEGMPEFYGNGQMRQGMPQNANGAGGNHALQDYQMQLMLLEQQNKKRLLMARQEQDNLRPDQQGNMPGQQPFPGPGPQGQPGMMNPQQAQQMQQQMQQVQQQQQQQQQQGQQGPQPGQPGQPPQNPQAQAQMGTPQQRNAAMPPPQNVPAPGAAAANGRPASPAQSAASTTPQQANKANPKKKDAKEPRKRPNKKGAAAAATPSAEGDAPPPTPTPQTPITPMNKGFNEQAKNGQQPNQNAQAQGNASAPNQGASQSQSDQGMMTQFEGMDGQMDDVNMDFSGLDTGDVLTTFDFDAFLQDDGTNQDFDISGFGNYDGLEAGGDAS